MEYRSSRGAVSAEALHRALSKVIGTDSPLRLAALAEAQAERDAVTTCHRSAQEAIAAAIAERAAQPDVVAQVAAWREERRALERANPGVAYGGTADGPISDREAVAGTAEGREWLAETEARLTLAAQAEEAAALLALPPPARIFSDALRALEAAAYAAYAAAQ